MTIIEKRDILKSEILKSFSWMRGYKVALFGLPCHGNIGDALIALGEKELFKILDVDCIYTRQLVDGITDFPCLPKDCIIIFTGGGDFGDVWSAIQKSRLRTISHYRNHKIVIFPQTVYYHDQTRMRDEALFLAKIKDLTICCRDKESLKCLSEHFKNKIQLVPDMAFCINPSELTGFCVSPKGKNLYLKRIDKEFANNGESLNLSSDTIVSDWPLIDNQFRIYRYNMLFNGLTGWLNNRAMKKSASLIQKLFNKYLMNYGYKTIAKCGVRFLSSYGRLTVTRLHAAILAILLNKEVSIIDNSYHKNKSFFDAWLSDADGVTLF